MSERTYTLDEARRELTRQECRLHGHDFEILLTLESLDPKSLYCGRGCGAGPWTVVTPDGTS